MLPRLMEEHVMREHDEPAFGVTWKVLIPRLLTCSSLIMAWAVLKAQFMRCHLMGLLDWAIPLQLTYEVAMVIQLGFQQWNAQVVHPDGVSHVSRHTGGVCDFGVSVQWSDRLWLHRMCTTCSHDGCAGAARDTSSQSCTKH